MAYALTPLQLEQALQGISVPPQPQILVDLQMELYLPGPDLGAIGKLITLDPGLSGAVLRVANSAPFGLLEPTASIAQAAELLGADVVIALINAQSIKGEMADETIVTLNRFWDDAQDVAGACAAIARHLGTVTVDEAYLAGLLHDCGVPLMLMRFPGYMTTLETAYAVAEQGLRIVDTENQAFNTNHAVVGYYAAKAWRLPLSVCTAIAGHHNAQALMSDERGQHSAQKDLLAVLKMAEHISASHHRVGNQPMDHEWNRVGEWVLDYVGLSEYDFDNLKETLRESGAR